jgi:nitronate monooxygenase
VSGPLSELGVRVPIVAAPMAGGPTTPVLVIAAADAGALGFLAAGYLSAEVLATQGTAVRARTDVFGVNLFAPNPVPVDPTAYAAYRGSLLAEAARRGVELPEAPVEDDDGWAAKVDLLVSDPVPVVSFTFGIPDSASLAALRGAGSVLVQTVTSADEARQAESAGVDLLAVQAHTAGGHSGTLTPERATAGLALLDLLADVRRAVDLPLLAAGGLATPAEVGAVVRAGATPVVGTALLLANESGTSAAHRHALLERSRDTAVMRAFTGRPARGLRNAFYDAHEGAAPAGYPALHHLTRPLRKAAAAAGDPEGINLWAGVGYRSARAAPVRELLQELAAEL